VRALVVLLQSIVVRRLVTYFFTLVVRTPVLDKLHQIIDYQRAVLLIVVQAGRRSDLRNGWMIINYKGKEGGVEHIHSLTPRETLTRFHQRATV